MIGPTNRKNTLTFGGDLVPDTDSWSLFQFSRHCGIGNFRRHNMHFLYSHRPTFTTRSEMTDADKVTRIHKISGAILQISGSESGLIRNSGFSFD